MSWDWDDLSGSQLKQIHEALLDGFVGEADFARFHMENSVERSFFDLGLLRRGGTGFNRTHYVSVRCTGKDTRVTSAQILTSGHELIAEVPVKIDFEGFPSINLTLSDSDNWISAGSPAIARK